MKKNYLVYIKRRRLIKRSKWRRFSLWGNYITISLAVVSALISYLMFNTASKNLRIAYEQHYLNNRPYIYIVSASVLQENNKPFSRVKIKNSGSAPAIDVKIECVLNTIAKNYGSNKGPTVEGIKFLPPGKEIELEIHWGTDTERIKNERITLSYNTTYRSFLSNKEYMYNESLFYIRETNSLTSQSIVGD